MLMVVPALLGAVASTPAFADVPPVSITDGSQLSDYGFDPAELSVSTGDTITWTNTGSQPHTVTASDGSFDSGLIQPGDSFTYAYTAPGTFTYVCTPHPWMKATVNVSDAS